MVDSTVPEILRVNLTSLILTMKCIGIKDVLNFDYMEKPDDGLIIRAIKQLVMLGALDNKGKLVPFGRELCKYPMEPHFSKSLLMAKFLDCEEELLTIVATLSTENIWMRISKANFERFEDVQRCKSEVMEDKGDHMTNLKIYPRKVVFLRY